MPVTIHPALLAPSRKQSGPRRRHFDQAVRKLALVIAEIRNEGSRGVKEIMDALNARGVAATNGKVFTFGTTHRVLRRLYQLGLGPKLRTLSKALSERPYKPRVSGPRRSRGMTRAGKLAVAEFEREYLDMGPKTSQ
jgi:hypothetical protein